ncbi:TIGR04255 family protein [Henriciella sp.]|uniref:TIGR04255 family protein n=1 Tax=Henriciella sp. TaxID=1968823 RepID=UPI00261C0041|nr:TIGR04255 family protein [Henriciella sp.]
MTRPSHLPDFLNPPINEVALGVQFGAIPNFTSVGLGEVWSLFQHELPAIQEHPPLAPQFETFGGASPGHSVQFRVGSAPAENRLWFISEDESHLVQFQKDRFLTNWRKRGGNGEYPRFETILSSFKDKYQALEEYIAKRYDHKLRINQAEVTYFNIIPVEEFSDVGIWMESFNAPSIDLESMNTQFKEVLNDSADQPFGRAYFELQSAVSIDGKKKAFRFDITVRGTPDDEGVASAVEFFQVAREKIVCSFKELTTEKAHDYWGIKK